MSRGHDRPEDWIERQVAQFRRDDRVVQAHLYLVDVVVDLETIRGWSKRSALLAQDWAELEHIAAHGGDVRVPKKPGFLP